MLAAIDLEAEADQLREEIAETGKVKASDCDAAMTTIVAAIRGMEDSGTLVLVVKEEEEED